MLFDAIIAFSHKFINKTKKSQFDDDNQKFWNEVMANKCCYLNVLSFLGFAVFCSRMDQQLASSQTLFLPLEIALPELKHTIEEILKIKNLVCDANLKQVFENVSRICFYTTIISIRTANLANRYFLIHKECIYR